MRDGDPELRRGFGTVLPSLCASGTDMKSRLGREAMSGLSSRAWVCRGEQEEPAKKAENRQPAKYREDRSPVKGQQWLSGPQRHMAHAEQQECPAEPQGCSCRDPEI